MSNDVQIIAEHISLSELQKELAMPKPGQMFIDVRSPEEFAIGHIPGFTNFPLDEIDEFMNEFSKKDVVLSCQSGVRCKKVAERLHVEGHVRKITEYSGGFKDWQAAGLPVESGVSSGHANVEKDYHPELEDHHIHNGDDTLSKVKKNLTRTAGNVSHHVFDQAKATFGGFEKQFVALPPLRQVYAILGILILMSAVISGVAGILLSLFVALALIFSSITGIMFMTDWVQKMPWNRKK